MEPSRNERAGIALAAASYVLWGVLPLYWRLLDSVPPFEIAVHRILWGALFVGILTLWRGRWKRVRRIFRTPVLIRALTISCLLIATNWTIYIYSISLREVLQAALGYFINPLLTILLGVVFLKERISKVRLVAVVLAGAALALKAVTYGHIPLIALGLAVTFGFYGLVRKRTPVDPLDGLFVETVLLLPLTVLCVGYWWWRGTGSFPAAPLSVDALLVAAGPVTAIPLMLFAAGVRRIRLSTLGFLQYFSPSITLLIAVAAFHEPFGRIDLAVFGCIWAALALVALEGRLTRQSTSER